MPDQPADPHVCPTCRQSLVGIEEVFWDEEANIIVSNGRAVLLAPKEMEIAIILRDRYPRSVSTDAFMNAMYIHDNDVTDNNIAVHICRIRSAIKGTGLAIDNMWGRGFRLKFIQKEGAL